MACNKLIVFQIFDDLVDNPCKVLGFYTLFYTMNGLKSRFLSTLCATIYTKIKVISGFIGLADAELSTAKL